MSVYKWSQAPANNATIDATINYAEGQAPSSLNDSARATMAAVAKWRDDLNASNKATTGSSNAYVLTTNQGLTSLTSGFTVAFLANHTNTGASTLNVDGLGAKPLRIAGSTATPAGSLVANAAYLVSYEQSGDQWLLINAPSHWSPGDIKWSAVATAEVGWLQANGAAVSRTTYAALFARIGTAYGAGDGSTTFNLPDIRGRVIAGYDAGAATGRLTSAGSGINSSTMGAAGGNEASTLSSASQLPSHTHTFSGTTGDAGTHTHSTSGGPYYRSGSGSSPAAGSGGSGGASNPTADADGNHSHSFSGTTSATGSGAAFTTQPPTIVLFPVIKY